MSRSKAQLIEQRQGQVEQLLHPDYFYRLIDGHRFFGYSPDWIDAKIKAGEIPKPVSLSDKPGSRGKGWFGRTILAWQA